MATSRRRRMLWGMALVVAVTSPWTLRVAAQTRPPAPYEKLAIVQPEFDGWYRNPDGTLSFSFGYINRSDKPITIPVGPDNAFLPGPASRGQPTMFQPGTERNALIVVLPKDFDQNLVWSVSANGMKATNNQKGGLNPLYMISDVPPKVIPGDAPARPELGPPRRIKLADSTRLNATVRTNTSGEVKIKYKWTKRVGPGSVTFAPADAPQATATFSEPGEYIVRLTVSRESGMDEITGSGDFKIVVER